jgi:hypothetical protein
MTDEDFIKHISKSIPIIPATDPRFVWVPSEHTDVQKTWEKFGWTPTERKDERKTS